MPQIGIRVSDELHHQIRAASQEQRVSVSHFIKRATEQVLDGCQPMSISGNQVKLITLLEEQLHIKDEQIRELHRLTALSHQQALANENHRRRWRWFWLR